MNITANKTCKITKNAFGSYVQAYSISTYLSILVNVNGKVKMQQCNARKTRTVLMNTLYRDMGDAAAPSVSHALSHEVHKISV